MFLFEFNFQTSCLIKICFETLTSVCKRIRCFKKNGNLTSLHKLTQPGLGFRPDWRVRQRISARSQSQSDGRIRRSFARSRIEKKKNKKTRYCEIRAICLCVKAICFKLLLRPQLMGLFTNRFFFQRARNSISRTRFVRVTLVCKNLS